MNRIISAALALIVATASHVAVASADVVSGPERIIPKAYFGAHCFYCGASLRWAGEADTVFPNGAGAWRLWDAYGTVWRALEPIRGHWQFRYLDHYVSVAQSLGVELVITLGQTPRWASARPDEKAGGGLGAAAEPLLIDEWKNYIRQVATRYKGRIQYYEVWNEPAIADIEKTVNRAGKAGYYSGGAGALVELERAAAEVLRAVDPAAKLVAPSFAGHHMGLRRLDAYLKAGGGVHADVIGFHFYQVDKVSPEALPGLVSAVRDVMRRFGLAHKPLWNTESGLIVQPRGKVVKPLEPSGNGSLAVVWPEDDAAALVSRYLILGAASGLERFFWFAWDSGSMGLSTFSAFGTPRETNRAGLAFLKTREWLEGARIERCELSEDAASFCSLRRGARQDWIAWSTAGPTDFQPPGDGEVSRTVTLRGEIQPWGGRVRVGESPTLIEGR